MELAPEGEENLQRVTSEPTRQVAAMELAPEGEENRSPMLPPLTSHFGSFCERSIGTDLLASNGVDKLHRKGVLTCARGLAREPGSTSVLALQNARPRDGKLSALAQEGEGR